MLCYATTATACSCSPSRERKKKNENSPSSFLCFFCETKKKKVYPILSYPTIPTISYAFHGIHPAIQLSMPRALTDRQTDRQTDSLPNLTKPYSPSSSHATYSPYTHYNTISLHTTSAYTLLKEKKKKKRRGEEKKRKENIPFPLGACCSPTQSR